jgi:hypothetical protein
MKSSMGICQKSPCTIDNAFIMIMGEVIAYEKRKCTLNRSTLDDREKLLSKFYLYVITCIHV